MKYTVQMFYMRREFKRTIFSQGHYTTNCINIENLNSNFEVQTPSPSVNHNKIIDSSV